MSLALRSLLAGVAAAALLAYGAAGHLVAAPSSHDDMAGSALGLCLLLVTILGITRLKPPQQPATSARFTPRPLPPLNLAIGPLDRRARASPRVLQRFLN